MAGVNDDLQWKKEDIAEFTNPIHIHLTGIIKSQAATIMRQDRELIDLRGLIASFFKVMEHGKKGVIG